MQPRSMLKATFSVVLNIGLWSMITVWGQLGEICQTFYAENDCVSNSQCQWLASSTSTSCICTDDINNANIDIWFVLESSSISQEMWDHLMIALAADVIKYIKEPNTNVYLLRFGDNWTELLSNPTLNETLAWSYQAATESTICHALEQTENYLQSTTHAQNRKAIVITVFGNSIDDPDSTNPDECATTSLSADIVYGVFDTDLADSDEFGFLGIDGHCTFDFSVTFEFAISAMETYALSVISDYICVLSATTDTPTTAPPTTPEPTHKPTTQSPSTTATKMPTKEYTPYVRYVYHRYKPEKIRLARSDHHWL